MFVSDLIALARAEQQCMIHSTGNRSFSSFMLNRFYLTEQPLHINNDPVRYKRQRDTKHQIYITHDVCVSIKFFQLTRYRHNRNGLKSERLQVYDRCTDVNTNTAAYIETKTREIVRILATVVRVF